MESIQKMGAPGSGLETLKGKMSRIWSASMGAVMIGAMGFAAPGLAMAAGTATYKAQITIPAAPASSFTANAGGDGWDLSMTPEAVYNVYHHSTFAVACHRQSDASNCWGDSASKMIVDASGNSFETSNASGTYINQKSGHLFSYATRDSDGTRGVVCVDTTRPVADPNPFCGFTALTPANTDVVTSNSPSNGVLVGTKYYAFNSVQGATATGAKNKMMCFDTATEEACAGQPYPIGFPGKNDTYAFAITAAGGRIFVPSYNTTGGSFIACFNTATNAACTGSWPVFVPGYGGGAPFAKLSATGTVTGICLPTTDAPCFDLTGKSVATPPDLYGAMGTNFFINNSVVIGSRAYIIAGDTVRCYDYKASAQCANFPHDLPGSSLTYTINLDPHRAACLWTNADGGDAQIQNFDAFSGGACDGGGVRVFAASFFKEGCEAVSYEKLQILKPVRTNYTSATISFRDASGNPIPGIPDQLVDSTGSVNLTGLNLNQAGLPQFIVKIDGNVGPIGEITLEMTWKGPDTPACGGPTPAPKAVVLTAQGLLVLDPPAKIEFRAKLTEQGTKTAIKGKVIEFWNEDLVTLERSKICQAVTNSKGEAACGPLSLPTLQATAQLGYRAIFRGDASYLTKQAAGGFIRSTPKLP